MSQCLVCLPDSTIFKMNCKYNFELEPVNETENIHSGCHSLAGLFLFCFSFAKTYTHWCM